MATVKRMSIYVDDEKCAELMNANLRFNTNGERVHAQEGVVAGTDGNMEIDITADLVVLEGWPGASGKAIDAINTRKELRMSGYVGGKLWEFPAKCVSGEIKSENKTGMVSASLAFQNTGPETVS